MSSSTFTCSRTLKDVGHLLSAKQKADLICPACELLFVTPKLLPCGHAICAACVTKRLLELAESLEEPVENLQKPAESLQEPVESLQEPAESLQEPVESLQKPVKTIQCPGCEIEHDVTSLKDDAERIKLLEIEVPAINRHSKDNHNLISMHNINHLNRNLKRCNN